MNRPTIELLCRKADAHIFALLGFTLDPDAEDHGGTAMVHQDPNPALVVTLLHLGPTGQPFVASVWATASYGGIVMAGDGTHFTAAPAIGDCKQPVARVGPDGTLDGLERAREYWIVQATFMASLAVRGVQQ